MPLRWLRWWRVSERKEHRTFMNQGKCPPLDFELQNTIQLISSQKWLSVSLSSEVVRLILHYWILSADEVGIHSREKLLVCPASSKCTWFSGVTVNSLQSSNVRILNSRRFTLALWNRPQSLQQAFQGFSSPVTRAMQTTRMIFKVLSQVMR